MVPSHHQAQCRYPIRHQVSLAINDFEFVLTEQLTSFRWNPMRYHSTYRVNAQYNNGAICNLAAQPDTNSCRLWSISFLFANNNYIWTPMWLSWALSQYKTVFPRYGDSHVKDKTVARPSYLNMVIPFRVRRHLYIVTAPRFLCEIFGPVLTLHGCISQRVSELITEILWKVSLLQLWF